MRLSLSFGKALKPTWIHSAVPPGPCSVPPRPSQAPTWPADTLGVCSGSTTAPIPCVLVVLCTPAYEYAAAPQAFDFELRPSATEVATNISASVIRIVSVRRAKKTSGQRGRAVQSGDRPGHAEPPPSTQGRRSPHPSTQGRRSGLGEESAPERRAEERHELEGVRPRDVAAVDAGDRLVDDHRAEESRSQAADGRRTRPACRRRRHRLAWRSRQQRLRP